MHESDPGQFGSIRHDLYHLDNWPSQEQIAEMLNLSSQNVPSDWKKCLAMNDDVERPMMR
jgi:hypothetical protein